MKVFISQPMNGRDPEEIESERYKIQGLIEAETHGEVEVIDSYFGKTYTPDKPVRCLAESLKLLEDADLVVFAHGWEQARGCRVENLVCVEYGIAHKEL